MSGRGKEEKVKGKAKSRSSRADLQFQVGRFYTHTWEDVIITENNKIVEILKSEHYHNNRKRMNIINTKSTASWSARRRSRNRSHSAGK